jgi:hypothetical protein
VRERSLLPALGLGLLTLFVALGATGRLTPLAQKVSTVIRLERR